MGGTKHGVAQSRGVKNDQPVSVTCTAASADVILILTYEKVVILAHTTEYHIPKTTNFTDNQVKIGRVQRESVQNK